MSALMDSTVFPGFIFGAVVTRLLTGAGQIAPQEPRSALPASGDFRNES